jgi:hypothetical protein
MSLALERHRTQVVQEVTLQGLYTEQVRNLNQGITRLVSGLGTVLQMGLYPVVAGLAWLVNLLASAAQKLLEFEYIGGAAVIAVTAAGLFLISRLKGLALALYGVALAARDATRKLQEHALAQLAARVPGAGGAAGGLAGAGVTGLFGIGLASVAALTVIAAGIAFLGYKLYELLKVTKDSADETRRVNQAMASRSQALDETARQKMYFRARSGDTEGALRYLSAMLVNKAADMRNQRLPVEVIQAELERMRAQSEEDMTLGRATMTTFGSPYLDKMQYDATGETVKALEVQTKSLEVLKKILDTTKQGVEKDKDSDREEADRNEGKILRLSRDTWWGDANAFGPL